MYVAIYIPVAYIYILYTGTYILLQDFEAALSLVFCHCNHLFYVKRSVLISIVIIYFYIIYTTTTPMVYSKMCAFCTQKFIKTPRPLGSRFISDKNPLTSGSDHIIFY